MHIRAEIAERHTLSVLVDNEAGILARIAGMFSARGYNIESLTVADVTEDLAISRITIVTSGSPHVMEQITAQLERLVPVHKVADLTSLGPHLERELALIKVAGTGEHRIEAMRLADISEDHALSRITIVTKGPPPVIDQIMAQLERLVPVHKVVDLTEAGAHVERELALVKVTGKGEHRVEALRLADVFRAQVVDTTTESFIFELTGQPSKIDSFVALMRELGLVEVGRTGIVGMMRGAEGA